MPVATMLAIAASFWSTHGYIPQQEVTWDWGIPSEARVEPGYIVEGFAMYHSYHIYLNRTWWDRVPNWRKCEVVIHETGHADFGFPHEDNSVMSAFDDSTRTIPGTCLRRKW